MNSRGRDRTPARGPRAARRAGDGVAPPARSCRCRGGQTAAPRDRRPARRLRAAPATSAGRAAARRRRRPDRRGQVDPGQLPRRCPGQRRRGPAPDDPVGGARPSPGRRALVRRAQHPARSRAQHRQQQRSRQPAARAQRAHPGRPGAPRRPRHRLGRLGQPRAGHPAARRGRHVDLRDDRRPLRRRGAMGLPARRGDSRHRGRRRPGPCSRGRHHRGARATSPPC